MFNHYNCCHSWNIEKGRGVKTSYERRPPRVLFLFSFFQTTPLPPSFHWSNVSRRDNKTRNSFFTLTSTFWFAWKGYAVFLIVSVGLESVMLKWKKVVCINWLQSARYLRRYRGETERRWSLQLFSQKLVWSVICWVMWRWGRHVRTGERIYVRSVYVSNINP